MRAASREARAEHFCDALFTFVDVKLDELDRAATQGLRAGRPNFLLVIDQFEEIFRPEVSADEASGGGELLDLLLNAFARLERETSLKADARSGLFIILTMRSEELHRCTEHPSVAVRLGTETAHRSPPHDQPVRLSARPPRSRAGSETTCGKRSFDLPAGVRGLGATIDRSNRDAPFAAGVADWLLRGTNSCPWSSSIARISCRCCSTRCRRCGTPPWKTGRSEACEAATVNSRFAMSTCVRAERTLRALEKTYRISPRFSTSAPT